MEYKDKEWLIQALEKYGNVNNLCNETGYAKTTVRKYVKRYDLTHLSNPKKHIKKVEGVLYNNKDWLEEQLRIHGSGKRISEVHNISVTNINRWIRKYELQDNRNVGQSRRIHTLDEFFFEQVDTEEKAYWLGFIVADGCIYHNSTSYDITFTLGLEDAAHLEKLRTAWNNDNEITTNPGTKGNIDVHYRVHSKRLFKFLENLGVQQRKTGKEHFPDIPAELIRHFIRGYFDGDGSTFVQSNNYGRIGFNICCANEGFLELIKNHLESMLKIEMNPIRPNGNNNYFLDMKNRDKCYRIYSYIYTDCHHYLDRKYETISHFLNEYSPPVE